MNDLSIDPPYLPVWIARTASTLLKMNRVALVTNEATRNAIKFLGMLEIETGISDPEVKIGRHGSVIFKWSVGQRDLILIVRSRSVTGRARALVRYVVWGKYDVECTSVMCGIAEVRRDLVSLFLLREKWQAGQES